MKKSTLIVLGVLALLVVVWLVASRKPANEALPPLDIAGYIGNVTEQEARAQAKDKPSPVTKIALTRKGETIVLERGPEAAKPADKPAEGAPPPETKWQAERTVKGKKTSAKAQSFRVQSMADMLQRTIRATHAQRISPQQAGEYEFDADHAIAIELTMPGRTVKLTLGHLDKGQDADTAATWVQDPVHPEVAYQVSGRDLRSAFEVSWSELRDKAVFALEPAAVDKLALTAPGLKVVATRAARTDATAQRPVGEGWQIAEPAGTATGDIGDWLSAIERLTAEEFLDTSDVAERKLTTGLDAPDAVRLTIGFGGKETTLVIGGKDEKGRFYATVNGSDEVCLLAAYGHDQVVRTLDQLRERHLLGAHKAKDATGFRLQTADGAVTATRGAQGWQLDGDVATSDKAVAAWLDELDGIQVDYGEPATPSAAGLDAPGVRLVVDFGGQQHTVALGKELEGNTWGTLSGAKGKTETFHVSSWNAKRLSKKPADFEDKRLLAVTASGLVGLTLKSEANIIKLPNISASVGQLTAAIKELQGKGYALLFRQLLHTPNNGMHAAHGIPGTQCQVRIIHETV